jgi:hypothetical protein
MAMLALDDVWWEPKGFVSFLMCWVEIKQSREVSQKRIFCGRSPVEKNCPNLSSRLPRHFPVAFSLLIVTSCCPCSFACLPLCLAPLLLLSLVPCPRVVSRSPCVLPRALPRLARCSACRLWCRACPRWAGLGMGELLVGQRDDHLDAGAG